MYAPNVNFAYAVQTKESFSIFLFVGVGYVGLSLWSHSYIDGRVRPSDIPHYIELGPNQSYEGYTFCNLGFNLEYHVSKNLFVTSGLKYMFGMFNVSNTDLSSFPYINVGLGYSFKHSKTTDNTVEKIF